MDLISKFFDDREAKRQYAKDADAFGRVWADMEKRKRYLKRRNENRKQAIIFPIILLLAINIPIWIARGAGAIPWQVLLLNSIAYAIMYSLHRLWLYNPYK